MSNKISTNVLNKLVDAFNAQVKTIEALPVSTPQEDVVVELSKVLGMVSTISLESSALVSDIKMMINKNALPEQDISGLLGAIGGKTIDKN